MCSFQENLQMYLQISTDLQMSSTLSDTQVCLEMSKTLHMWRCITTELQMFSTISTAAGVYQISIHLLMCFSTRPNMFV